MNKMQAPTPSRFEETLKQYIQWIKTHQEQFWATLGIVLGGGLLVVFMIHRRDTENEEAWAQLGPAQGYVMQGDAAHATQALDQWNSRFQGTQATFYAKFLRADLLYNTSNYAAAAQVYGDLAQTGQPKEIRPLALSAQSSSEEMAGNVANALSLTQQFLEKYPDHFLSAAMYINQARLTELSGNPTSATSLYDRFVILYPQSPWTTFARARLKALSPATPPLPQK